MVAAKNETLDAFVFTAIGGAPITTQAGGSTLSSGTVYLRQFFNASGAGSTSANDGEVKSR